jgi:transcriptional regulator with XRE-family HTH domain
MLAGRSMPPGATSALVPSLRYWRTRRALFQRGLAERAGVQPLSVQRGEHGQALRVDTIRKLADVLEVRPADLMAEPPEG